MIFGHLADGPLAEDGLYRLGDVSIETNPETLRALARFLAKAADEMESAPRSPFWHRHAPESVCRELGGDLVVLADDGGRDDLVVFADEGDDD